MDRGGNDKNNRVHNYLHNREHLKNWALQNALLDTLPLQKASGYSDLVRKNWIGKI